MKKIEDVTVHCKICNEENWIWFSLKSLLPYCGKVMVWDTGSTDYTLQIIEEINSPDIQFVQCGKIHPEEFKDLHNDMIKATVTDWFAIVDGDEIWPGPIWSEIAYRILDSSKDILVAHYFIPFPRLGYLGLDEGNFKIAGKVGAFTAKVFRRKHDILWYGEFPDLFLRYKNGVVASQGELSTMQVLESPIYHMTMLERSSLDSSTFGRAGKLTVTDVPNKKDFKASGPWWHFPDVLFEDRPDIVPNPFLIHNNLYHELAPIPHPSLMFL